jgi:GxxExxY protein
VDDDELAATILGAAFRVHTRLGPGLLESIYQRVLVYELVKAGLAVEVQKSISIFYDEIQFEEGYRAD